jgi:hypothetical protein
MWIMAFPLRRFSESLKEIGVALMQVDRKGSQALPEVERQTAPLVRAARGYTPGRWTVERESTAACAVHLRE